MDEKLVKWLAEQNPEFSSEPWYNAVGDCIVCLIADEAAVADRLDDLVTLYRSAVDNRCIGFKIKDVAAIVRNYGLEGLGIQTVSSDGEILSLKVSAVLLAAYESGPRNVARRMGYGEIFASGHAMGSIPAAEIRDTIYS